MEAPPLNPVAAFIRLGRPKFLFQSMIVVAMGVTFAVTDGHSFDLLWYLVTLLFGWCTHLMTHYCNEYFDLEADQANTAPTSWTGGSRVLVNGLLSPMVSLTAAFVLMFIAFGLITAMPTVLARLIAVATIALAWFYTAPPLRLNYHGLGELTAAAVLYGLGPILACYLQQRSISAAALALVGVVFAFQFLRMTVMNLFDIEGDRTVGKRTLAVVLGERRLIRFYIVGQSLVYLTVVLLAELRVVPLPVGLALLLSAAVPIWVARNLLSAALHDSSRGTAVTFWASMHMPVSATAIILGLFANTILAGQPVPVTWLCICAAALVIFGSWLARSIGRDGRRRTPPSTALAPQSQQRSA